VQDGHAVIGALLPDTPAALSGQIHPGDRIVGVAQGDNRFVDAANLSLGDLVGMIRGAPGSLVQLQIVPANAAPGSLPLTVPIIRDQIRHKQ
jgi:carboxyl-terminal processing protease